MEAKSNRAARPALLFNGGNDILSIVVDGVAIQLPIFAVRDVIDSDRLGAAVVPVVAFIGGEGDDCPHVASAIGSLAGDDHGELCEQYVDALVMCEEYEGRYAQTTQQETK